MVLPVVESSSRLGHVVDPHASLRQSPPPVNNAVIPPGAVISPPESTGNSSDEDGSPTAQRRDAAFKMEELEAAVRSIGQRRESSPQRPQAVGGATATSSSGSFTPDRAPVEPLSKEARKISHSRSSTENSIVMRSDEVVVTSSPDESDREDGPKPPMLRKKSGELVRPALRPPSARRRPSSMPGTPTFAKAVHFDSQLEHIRHFMQLDKPLAVSAETSPVEDYDSETEFPFGHEDYEWELRLANFPTDVAARAHQPVRLERVFLSSDKKTLVGVVAVANLAFHKSVVARFTFDYWKTTSEVTAEFNHDVRRKQANDGYDRFSFSIKLADQANLENKTMFACIRYNVNGQEFWDNNNFMNYQIDFTKVPKARKSTKADTTKPKVPTSSARPSLPRSRRSTGSINARTHSVPPSFDDFSALDDEFSWGMPKTAGRRVPRAAPVVDADADGDAPLPPREKQNRQAFGNRYDFGASLSAAMRSKVAQDRTLLTTRLKSSPDTSSDEDRTAIIATRHDGLFVSKASPTSDVSKRMVHADNSRPSPLGSSGKPHLDSSVYKELVDKYCFVSLPPRVYPSVRGTSPLTDRRVQYGSPKGSNSPNAQMNNEGESTQIVSTSSSPSPPASPRLVPRADPTLSIRTGGSRSASTSPAGLRSRGSPSPVSFGYPYHPPMQNSFLTESQTPTVIRG